MIIIMIKRPGAKGGWGAGAKTEYETSLGNSLERL